MIPAALLGALGTTGALIAFLFWQARRAARATDGEIRAMRRSAELELHCELRGKAIEDRDKAIGALTGEITRLNAALAEALKQRDSLVANLKDPHAAVDLLRDALRAPSVPVVPTTADSATPAPGKAR